MIAGSLGHARRWRSAAPRSWRANEAAGSPFLPLVVLAALGACCSPATPCTAIRRSSPQALVGKPMPDLTLPSLDDGAPVRLRDAAAGRPVLVNFFASWCAPCEIEQPVLMQLKAHKASGSSASPTRTRRTNTHRASSTGWAIPSRSGWSTATAAPASSSASPACRRPIWWRPDGVILDKHTGPLDEADARALAAKSLTAR